MAVKKRICYACYGEGQRTPGEICPTCKGTGEVELV